ncbi:hypothetical protein L484_001227 [Morus notabilis]|uniref:Uncharacterized protein n=1 Tax=Morus notabilis TaxID=981085 RepID=W9SL56_9ROSA|nr:hypothetical protein L484_001227 [Morus notabilis]
MEKKEDERIDRPGIGSGEQNEDSFASAFNQLDSAFRMVEAQLIHYETKLSELRTTAIRHILNGEVERLKDLEQEVKEFNAKIERLMKTVEGSAEKLNDTELAVFERSGTESFAEFEDGYDEKMREQNPMKMKEAEEGRRIGNKTLIEMLEQLNQSSEGRSAFVGIKATAISIGIDISYLLVDYFLVILLSEPEDIEPKIEEVKNTIQCWESLEANSVIIDMFVSVLELIGREMRNSPRGSAAEKEEIMKESVSYGKREKDLLGTICFEVLNLDFAFGSPIFLMRSPHKEILVKIGKNIIKSFKLKMERIHLKIYEMWKIEFQSTEGDIDPETMELNKRLEMEIKERWYKLSFSKELINKVASLHIK